MKVRWTEAGADEVVRAARTYSPDPFADDTSSETAPEWAWIYAPGDYELATLHRIVAEGRSANRFVHYDDGVPQPPGVRRFRLQVFGALPHLELAATGTVRAWADGSPVATEPDAEDGRFVLASPGAGEELEVEVSTTAGQPAAVAFRVTATPVTWWQGGAEALPERRGGRVPPHLLGEPVVRVPLQLDGSLLVAPAAVLGRPVVTAAEAPAIAVGETPAEAFATPEEREARVDVVRRPDGDWTTRHELGGRWVRVDGSDGREIHFEARVRPVSRRGAFVCSDDTLNRIWGVSAYTLRACMQRLMIDGIKRDRMPWAGDQALCTLANAFTFADPEIVDDGLTAFGVPRAGYVNGISDYSLWWLITQGYAQRYFGNRPGVHERARQVDGCARSLAAHVDDRGLFAPPTMPSEFPAPNEGSVFLDWGVDIPRGSMSTALQVLWYWALTSAARVLEAADHPAGGEWEELAADVRGVLLEEGWDADRRVLREFLGNGSGPGAHANFLAVLANFGGGLDEEKIVDLISAHRGRTPFMTSFALRAMIRLGKGHQAVERIRDLWGPMLRTGATTFWEEFSIDDTSWTAMYGRPFGRSLCHAWSAGPAALLPEAVFGVRPLEDGWRSLLVEPDLGELAWAAGVIPLPHGDLVIAVDGAAVSVRIPAGSAL